MSQATNLTISRRSFLTLATSSAAAATLSLDAWASPKPTPVGIQLYMVKDDLEKDSAGTLQKVAAIGYQEVEPAGFGKLSATEFGKLVNAAGLRAPSAHLNFGMAETPKLLDDAKALGVHYAVSSILPPQPPSGGFSGILAMLNSLKVDDFKKIAALANKIGEQAKAVGLQYAYHNHNFEFRDLGGGETGYQILLHETDANLVKFEADCGWMAAAGVNPVSYLSKHGNRFAMLHIKDFNNIGKPVTTLMEPDGPKPAELGRGQIDYKPIIAAARVARIEHFFVEQEPPFTEMPAMEAAKVDYEALKVLLRNS